MNRIQMIDIVRNNILNNLNEDYNYGMIHQAIDTYLNNFTALELEGEINERIEFGCLQKEEV
jgi:hypothetical protein